MSRNHSWQKTYSSKAHRCKRPGCDVRRFKVPVLGEIMTVGWASLSLRRYDCPTSIRQIESGEVDNSLDYGNATLADPQKPGAREGVW